MSEYPTIGPETRTARSAVAAPAADRLYCCRKQRRQLVACGDFIRGPAEQWTSCRTERRILVDEATQDVLHFVVSLRLGIVRQCPPLHLQRRAIRIAAQLPSSFDE